MTRILIILVTSVTALLSSHLDSSHTVRNRAIGRHQIQSPVLRVSSDPTNEKSDRSDTTKKESHLKNQDKGSRFERENKIGRTGWNHNLPGPTSSFWVRTNNEEKNSVKIDSVKSRTDPIDIGNHKNNSSDITRPKTGWLHNKEPKKQSLSAPSNTNTKMATQIQSPPSFPSTMEDDQPILQPDLQRKIMNHRLISPPAFHPSGGNKVVVVTEHMISVPLSYFPTGKPPSIVTASNVARNTFANVGHNRIDVFFTVVEPIRSEEDEQFFRSLVWSYKKKQCTPQSHAQEYVSYTAKNSNPAKCLLFLQGGPGFGAPVPVCGIGVSEKSSWLGEALFGAGSSYFQRVVLMDQRGTGRSSKITKQSLEKLFPNLFALDCFENQEPIVSTKFSSTKNYTMSTIADELILWGGKHPGIASSVAAAITDAEKYLSHFRADNIVLDAESIKEAIFTLQSENEQKSKNDVSHPWGGALGQSYGGFCLMTYLSTVPHPPKMCLFTGGIAPVLSPMHDLYTALWERVKTRNRLFYNQYPGDVAVVKRIVRLLMDEPQKLPSGGLLTARRFLQLGLGLGGSPSAFASLHELLSSAFVALDDDVFCRSFLKRIDSLQPFDDNPIYYLLHESIYADGMRLSEPTCWTAYKVYEQLIRKSPDFNYEITARDQSDVDTLFFGEVTFPWMAHGDYAELSGYGMRALAYALAYKNDWGPLYDSERMRQALASDGSGVSKAAAVLYHDDMYVDFHAAMEVTKYGAPLEDCKVWITNEYQHSGIRDGGSVIFATLIGMLNGSVRIPS